MDRTLMISILELLEEIYPEKYKVSKLVKRLELNSSDKEFSKVLAYLVSTSKINRESHEELVRLVPTYPNDELYITQFGIEFLTELKSLEINEGRNKAIVKATIVLALVGFMQAVNYFKQFSYEVNNLISWLMLIVMGIVLLIIFGIAWQSFTHLTKSRKKK